jgi:hypothetical protein
MENTLANSILSVCEVLNKHAVEYMLVGGAAVALHGYFRPSEISSGVMSDKPDLDFWYNPNYENYFKLLNALEELGQDVGEFKEEQAPNPRKSFFNFKFPNFTLDFLPELKAVLNFRASYNNRKVVTFNGIDIPFIGYDDLIADKKANSRPKDLDDIEQLELKRKKQNE